MKFLRQCINVLKEGLKSLWRNKAMGFASTISIAAMLILFGFISLMVLNLNTIVYQTTGKVDKVIFYLKDNMGADQVNDIIQNIGKEENVRNISYVSKEMAMDSLKEQFKDKSSVFDNFDINKLPASLVVEMKSLEKSRDLIEKVKNFEGIDKYSFMGDLVDKMASIKRGVKFLGAGIVTVLVFVSIVIINNTIKVAVSNRKKEISIMKYVGASNSYIRGPFLIEGITFGILGAILAFLVINTGYSKLYTIIMREISSMDLKLASPKLIAFDLLTIFLSIGVGIGYLGSLMSTKKFMDV